MVIVVNIAKSKPEPPAKPNDCAEDRPEDRSPAMGTPDTAAPAAQHAAQGTACTSGAEDGSGPDSDRRRAGAPEIETAWTADGYLRNLYDTAWNAAGRRVDGGPWHRAENTPRKTVPPEEPGPATAEGDKSIKSSGTAVRDTLIDDVGGWSGRTPEATSTDFSTPPFWHGLSGATDTFAAAFESFSALPPPTGQAPSGGEDVSNFSDEEAPLVFIPDDTGISPDITDPPPVNYDPPSGDELPPVADPPPDDDVPPVSDPPPGDGFPPVGDVPPGDDPGEGNRSPWVVAVDGEVVRGGLLRLSELVTAGDPEGDPIVAYRFRDLPSEGRDTGFVSMPGRRLGHGLEKTFENIDDANYRATGRTGTDHLEVQVSDGRSWSEWTAFEIEVQARGHHHSHSRTYHQGNDGNGPEPSSGRTDALPLERPDCEIPMPELPVSGPPGSLTAVVAETEWLPLEPDSLFA